MSFASTVISQEAHFIPLLDPIANAFAGTVTTSPINCKEAHSVTFVVWWGVGTSGTTTITVEACDDTSASNTSAIKFRSRVRTATDVWSAITERATTGFLTTAGSSQMYLIEVDVSELGASEYKYVRLKCVEGTASALLGGIHAVVAPRKARAIQATMLT